MKTTIKGSSLHQGIIDEVCRQIPNHVKEHITEIYWEYVPDEKLPLNEQIGYIISAMPNAGMYPTSLIVYQLVTGPTYVNSRDYELAKPTVADYLLKNKNTQELHNAIMLYRELKHCPTKYKDNDKFMLILLIADMFDIVASEHKRIDTYDELYNLIVEFSKDECDS